MVVKTVGKSDTAHIEGQQSDQTPLTGQSKRHVKCDEARPSCQRCTRTRRSCNYAEKKGISTASRIENNAVISGPASALSISSYAIPFKVPGSQRDRQVLHFFCVRGGYEIASHFNMQFWTNTVLQQSHQHSVVRQALVALSSLQLGCTTAAVVTPDHNNKPSALAQYGKAVHSLRRQIERPGSDTIKAALTCCILFCCFETALGDTEAAMRHLNGGLDLLSTHQNSQELRHDSQMGAMSRVFESLDLQATVFDHGRVPRLHLPSEDGMDNKAFSSLDEAYRTFTRIQNSLFHFLTTHTPHRFCGEDSLPSSVVEQKSHFQDRFRIWLARFRQSGFGNADKNEYFGGQILIIQWHVSKMLLDANYPADENIFRASPNPRAERILEMAQELLEYSQRGETIPNQDIAVQRRTLSSESGVVAPVFALAAKCSDEGVRDHALDLLTRAKRREGLYDSGGMAEIVQQFRTSGPEQILQRLKPCAENPAQLSLETLFDQKIDPMVGGIDELANRLGPYDCAAGRRGGHNSLLIALRTLCL